MTTIRCNYCDDLNDSNSVKCETCKSSLNSTASLCSDEDECERDFRFIEEAELMGHVYKLENLNDELEVQIHDLKSETNFDENTCGEIPEGDVESIVKLEDDDSENVSFEIVTVEAEPTVDIENGKQIKRNGILDFNKNASQIQKKKFNSNTKSEENQTAGPAIPYQCIHCSKSFKRKASLKAHINRVHNPDDESACCAGHDHDSENEPKSNGCASTTFADSCDSDYVCSGDESKKPSTHIKQSISPRKRRRKHKDNGEFNSENKNSPRKYKHKSLSPRSNSEEDKNNEIVYKCAACEKITDSYQEHLKHIVIHEKVDDSLTVPTSLEELKKTPSGFLQCKECEGVFMSEREYKIHQRSHEGVFQCDICKTILLTPSSLRKHKLRMHRQRSSRKGTLFECNICNEKYESQLLMLQHRKKHTEVMKKIEEMTVIDRSKGKICYVCKICAKTSNNKFRHEEHLRIHTKEKPYKCEKCGIGIATSNAMAHHMRTHENITFECNICAATYRHKKSLKKHLRLHTGERPFKCRHCDKTFTFNYTRADHERKCHVDGGTSRIPKRLRKSNSKKPPAENDQAAPQNVQIEVEQDENGDDGILEIL